MNSQLYYSSCNMQHTTPLLPHSFTSSDHTQRCILQPASANHYGRPISAPRISTFLYTNSTSFISGQKLSASSPYPFQLKHTCSSTICNVVGARPCDGSDVDFATSTHQYVAQANFPSFLANSLTSLLSSFPFRPPGLTQLASTLCNALENLISTMHPETNLLPNAQLLQGNFAPVAGECPPQACSLDEHSGPLPSFLEGIYIRNGPNEQYKSGAAPKQAASHPFDGDGMLHSVKFHGGKVTYCCRYVHTSRFVQEKAAGRALFPKIFSCLTIKDSYIATAHTCLAMLRHLFGLTDLSKGMGLANTSAVFHHGKLLALGEDDLPYALHIENNGDLINKGRYSFSGNGILPKTMTSHPKIDPVTGDMIFLSYNFLFRPYLAFFRISQDGVLSKPLLISLDDPSMIHDFAITPNYIIFPETQLVVHPLHMLKGKAAIKCDTRKVQRFGMLPRAATDDSELRWFDLPGCNCFHILNSWEEEVEEDNEQRKAGDVKEIVLVLPNWSNPDDLLSGKFDNVNTILTEVRLNLAEGGGATQRDIVQLAAKGDEINNINNMNVEMGTMNENYRGEKNRYVYMGVLGSSSSYTLSGLVKVDLKTGEVVACRTFDEGCYASEPLFVPSLPPSAYINSTDQAEEDEGILLCMLHNESGGTGNAENDAADSSDAECRMLVLDAQSATLDIIASVKIPRRVPYGFHGLFIPNNNINTPSLF